MDNSESKMKREEHGREQKLAKEEEPDGPIKKPCYRKPDG